MKNKEAIAKITVDGVEFITETIERIVDGFEPDENPEFIRGFKTFGEAVINALVKMSEEEKE